MRLALAQINTVVGDLDGNRDRILTRLAEARRRWRRPGPFPGARGHRLPARGPPPPAELPARRRAKPRAGRPRGPRSRRRSLEHPCSTAISSTPARSARTARSRASTASASCRTTGSSTRIGTSRRAATCSCSGSRRRSSARRSARTSGSPARPRRSSPSRGPTCSRTSRPRRSISARDVSASRCSPPGRGTTSAGSPS